MKLQQDARDGRNQFTTFAGDHVGINGEIYRGSLLVTPQVIEVWRPARFDDLAGDDFARALDFAPEVVLLGTGARLRFPHPQLYQDLIAARIGVEVMDSAAACRTFNILCGEGRRVVVLLLLE